MFGRCVVGSSGRDGDVATSLCPTPGAVQQKIRPPRDHFLILAPGTENGQISPMGPVRKTEEKSNGGT
jgi:hypothetical protein